MQHQAQRVLEQITQVPRLQPYMGGSLLAYLAHVRTGLWPDIRNDVYATNLWKGFFVRLPTQIRDVDVLAEYIAHVRGAAF